MEKSLSKIVPLVALKDLVDVIIPQKIEDIDSVELSIRIDNFGLNIRELTTFLSFIDRVYGRIKDWNLKKYSHLPSQQLKIETIRFGSVEIIVSEILIQAKENLTPIVVVLATVAILKPMAELVRSSAESYKLIAEAKKLLSEEIKIKAETQKLLSESNKFDEETKLISLNRQNLELENLESGDRIKSLDSLDQKRINQIFKLLREIYIKEEKSLPKIDKFASEKVKDLKLIVRKKKDL